MISSSVEKEYQGMLDGLREKLLGNMVIELDRMPHMVQIHLPQVLRIEVSPLFHTFLYEVVDIKVPHINCRIPIDISVLCQKRSQVVSFLARVAFM